MPDWTKKNFQRLRDQSPRDAAMQWKLARGALDSPELGVSRFTYEPSARMPFAHRHREQEEAYVVVAGSGRAKLDDDVVELSTWTCCASLPQWSARSRPARRDSTSSASAATSPRAATPSGSQTSGTEATPSTASHSQIAAATARDTDRYGLR